MASRKTIGGLTGLIGALIGGTMGYREAIASGTEPIQGALIFGAIGLILGSAGGFILRTLSALAMYAILLGVLAYFFRAPIEAMTGIDPVASAQIIVQDIIRFFTGGS